MFKNSPITPAGRWLLTLVFALCAFLPVAVIFLTLPKLALAMRWVLAGACLLWLIPLFYCTLQGQHWSRNLTSVLALALIPVLLVNWSGEQAWQSLLLMALAIAAWAVLTFVQSVRSPVPW